MSNNEYEWHDNAMKGIRGPISDGFPETGWYRNRKLISALGETPKRFEFQAVAYWKDSATGEQRCHVNGKSIGEIAFHTMWPYASKYPISEETYDAYLATGKWPEHNEALADQEAKSNEAPDDDSLEGVAARIDALVAEANRLMKKGAAKTKAEADAAADVAVKLGELHTLADNLRKAEKKPHRDAGLAVDAKWNKVRDAADIYADLKKTVVQPWLNAEDARKRKEIADAEAARQAVLKKAQDEAAAKQAEIDKAHAIAAQAAIDANKPIPKEPEKIEVQVPETFYREPAQTFVPTKVGTGKTISARAVRTAQIDDYAKALAHLADHPEIKALVQELANKLAKAKMPIPGCTILEDGKAI